MSTITAYGYLVTGPDYWINEVAESLKDPSVRWNWFRFEIGDTVWDANGQFVGVVTEISYENKTITIS
jgi:hypothetical protein